MIARKRTIPSDYRDVPTFTPSYNEPPPETFYPRKAESLEIMLALEADLRAECGWRRILNYIDTLAERAALHADPSLARAKWTRQQWDRTVFLYVEPKAVTSYTGQRCNPVATLRYQEGDNSWDNAVRSYEDREDNVKQC